MQIVTMATLNLAKYKTLEQLPLFIVNSGDADAI